MGAFDDLVPQISGSFEDLIPSASQRLQSDKPVAPLIPSRTSDQGGLWPVRHGARGIEFDPYAGVLGSLLRALTSPGDVYRGTVPTPYAPGANAAADPDTLSRASEVASLVSPMSPSYRAGARYGTLTPLSDDAWLPGLRGNLTKPPMTPPTAKEIGAAANTGYTSVRESGLETPSNLLGNLAGDIRDSYGARFSPDSAKQTFGRLEMMTDPKRSGTSMADLMAHRDALNEIIKGGGPDGKAAAEARASLDQFLDNLGAGNTRAAPGLTPTMAPEDVNATLRTARGNTRAAAAANQISGELDPAATGFLDRAEGRAGTPGRQAVDTQLRNRATALLESNAQIRSFQPEEVEALKAIRDGTSTRNALAWFGRRFGGVDLGSLALSGGLGGLTGLATGGTPSAMAALALATQGGGMIAKAVANAMARGQTQLAEELVRRNSPLGQSLAQGTLTYSPGAGRDAAVMRALMPGLLAPPPDPTKLPPGYI